LARFRWSLAPDGLTAAQKHNFRLVQADAVAVGIFASAQPFLAVFLARLGASSFQVGLLTSMPAITGLFLAIAIGQYLQRQRTIVPWYSMSRLISTSAYLLSGIVPFFVRPEHAVTAILVIWGAITVPQTIVSVAFSVVMSDVAGPEHRYDLMSRRWSVLGLVNAPLVALIGQVLVRTKFPVNYQVMFMVLSLGGLLSYYYCNRIRLPDVPFQPSADDQPPMQRLKGFVDSVRSQRRFVLFQTKRLAYFAGVAVAAPLLPLYYVHNVKASDAWIGIINTVSTALMLVGYPLWTRMYRQRGARVVLLATTLGMSLYPILTGMTTNVLLVTVYAGLAGIIGAGSDLVFFDELMKTVPPGQGATFVAVAQSAQYLATAIGPLVGSLVVGWLGIVPGLLLSGALRLVCFVMFALGDEGKAPESRNAVEAPPSRATG
jgi:hypothetical protein